MKNKSKIVFATVIACITVAAACQSSTTENTAQAGDSTKVDTVVTLPPDTTGTARDSSALR